MATIGRTPQGERIEVQEGPSLHKGTPTVVGVITAGVLTDRYEIPRRDHRRKTGYQREVSTTRVNRLVADLMGGRVDLPTAVLLNLRAFNRAVHLIDHGDDRMTLRLDGESLHVVDGQHRIGALSRLVEQDPDRWEGFQVPFVCMLGADERDEMEQFYVVNSTAKSVRTDLALDLLKQRAESDPEVLSSLIERGESWKVKGQTLVEELERLSPVWKGRIRFPGEPRGATTIRSSGMVSSLKPLLATPYFGSITTENQVKVLDAYWQGIRKVIPEVFDDPQEHVIQKMTGALVVHGLLIPVIEYVRSKGRSVIEPESYAEALSETLLNLQGDTSEGDIVAGSEFWKAGPDGAAGSFSSNAGRRVLTAKLRSLLPEVEVE